MDWRAQASQVLTLARMMRGKVGICMRLRGINEAKNRGEQGASCVEGVEGTEFRTHVKEEDIL